MKTKLEMAHDYLLKTMKDTAFVDESDICFFVDTAWKYADAMQAEAEKRNKEESAQKRKVIREMLNADNTFLEKEGHHFDDVCSDEKIEINMYPEWDASINYPPGAWVMYRGEKRLAVSIKKEWQPDWSQAPNRAMYWAMDGCGQCNWYEREPEVFGSQWDWGSVIEQADTGYDYKGDWRDSLRKRPQ